MGGGLGRTRSVGNLIICWPWHRWELVNFWGIQVKSIYFLFGTGRCHKCLECSVLGCCYEEMGNRAQHIWRTWFCKKQSPELPVPTTFPTVTYRIAPTGTFQPRFLAPSCSLRRPNGDKGAPQLRQAASTSKNGENDGKMMMNYGSWGYLGVPYLSSNKMT